MADRPAVHRLTTFGPVDAAAETQLTRCLAAVEDAGDPLARGVLCGDHHKGYSMPIGGVLASKSVVIPAGVGYDIACGNCAVRTDLAASAIDRARAMDEIWKRVSFGVGRRNEQRIADHPVFDAIDRSPVAPQRALLGLARSQLGTVGSGNHYVDLFEDRDDGRLWVGVHLGSRGFGHKTACGFLALAARKPWDAHVSESMDAPPLTIPIDTPTGQDYLAAMEIAGQYAYAGRDWVVDRVLRILGATDTMRVHNHHNFAWWEEHDGDRWLVIRKGATPAFPGQRGFVGGSMGDDAVILEGVDATRSRDALFSTVHGAGRVMGRLQAAGKWKRGACIRPGLVNWPAWQARLTAQGIELRGGGADESPECYKRLPDVLRAHGDTVRVLHTLIPIGVAMAGRETFDPYKD
jgi:tRNA-splicing ligase RtcB